MAKATKKHPFDVQVFLNTVASGRSVSKYGKGVSEHFGTLGRPANRSNATQRVSVAVSSQVTIAATS